MAVFIDGLHNSLAVGMGCVENQTSVAIDQSIEGKKFTGDKLLRYEIDRRTAI